LQKILTGIPLTNEEEMAKINRVRERLNPMRRIYNEMRMKEESHRVNFIKYKTPSSVSGRGNRHEVVKWTVK
jgi:hypothetical protein